MGPLAADDNRITVDTPLSECHVTAKGRGALAEGKFELELPGFDPELALDLLFAVAYCEDHYQAASQSV